MVAKNSFPAVGGKRIGTKRWQVLNQLTARVGRQAGDSFLNFLQ